MSQIQWLNPVSGDFSNSANWTGGVVPGAADDAYFDAPGGDMFTVTSTVNETVRSIFSESLVTLDVAGGRFTARKGTGPHAIDSLEVESGATFSASSGFNIGTIVNAGVITGTTGFGMECRNVINSGGVISPNAGARASISGDIYSGQIIAKVSTTIIVVDCNFIGCTLITRGTGVIETYDNCQFDGTLSPVANKGVFDILGPTSVTITGTLLNSGTISLLSTGNGAGLFVGRSATIGGGGTISLTGGAGDTIRSYEQAVLTNLDNTIVGSGAIGRSLTFINDAAGVIDANGASALTLNTGRNEITNAGTIEATGAGGCIVDSSLDNTGTLEADAGSLTVNAAVTGSGVAIVNSGTLDFASSFNEAVTFTGLAGTLELARSAAFTNSVTGFSQAGKTTLDLGDIGFIGVGEATYSGTASGGVLTVTDGTHTAHISLIGDYLGANFVASSDGHSGTDVVATTTQNPSAPHFISAMAAMTGHGVAAGLTDVRGVTDGRQMMLTAPRLAIA
jgi:hypothetical protein